MRAIVVDRWMDLSELAVREAPEPRLTPHGVLIEVRAAGCNFFDTLIVQGRYQVKPPLPFIPGGELAGVVREVGPEVSGIRVGDRVLSSGNTGGFAELAVVAGHRKKTVHTPGFCMAGGGWQMVSQSETTLKLAGKEVPAIRAVLVKEQQRLLTTYFFTDGSFATTSLPQFMLSQTLKRLRAKVPVGALVRIIVPVAADVASGDALTREFAAQTLPPVMAALRNAKLVID